MAAIGAFNALLLSDPSAATVIDGRGEVPLFTDGPFLESKEYIAGMWIGEAIGTGLSFEEISPEQVREAMIARDVPEDIPDRMLGCLAECRWHPGPSTDTVEQVLGGPALTIAEWAAEHAAAFRNDRMGKARMTNVSPVNRSHGA
jgi:hypothetical protein